MSLLELDNSYIADLYVNKKRNAESIARELGVCNHVIRKRLRNQGIKIRSQSETIQLLLGKTTPQIISDIVKLYKAGWSLEEIAQKFGIGLTTVSKHLRRLKLTRTSEESKRIRGTTCSGEKNKKWKGGKRVSAGYVYIKSDSHPRRDMHGYVAEHVIVWEKANNETLPIGWIVHHVNGIRGDNRPSNLIAMPREKHGYKGHTLLNICQKHVRELEIENCQLRRALEDSQAIFYINEN